ATGAAGATDAAGSASAAPPIAATTAIVHTGVIVATLARRRAAHAPPRLRDVRAAAPPGSRPPSCGVCRASARPIGSAELLLAHRDVLIARSQRVGELAAPSGARVATAQRGQRLLHRRDVGLRPRSQRLVHRFEVAEEILQHVTAPQRRDGAEPAL